MWGALGIRTRPARGRSYQQLQGARHHPHRHTENEDFLLGVALQGTAAHVEELVRQQRVIAQMREESGAENRQDGRSLHWRTDQAGYVVIEGAAAARRAREVLDVRDLDNLSIQS